MITDEILLTRGMTSIWPFAATQRDALGNSIVIPLTAAGMRLTFSATGTPEDTDANAFIIKDNYLYNGLTITNAAAGLGQIAFDPIDTTGGIWPYYPCLLYWGLKIILPSLQELPIGNGTLIVDQFTVKRTSY